MATELKEPTPSESPSKAGISKTEETQTQANVDQTFTQAVSNLDPISFIRHDTAEKIQTNK